MTKNIVHTRSNPVVQRLREIRDRKQAASLFCEGLKLVQALIDSRVPLKGLYCTEKWEENIRHLLKGHRLQNIPVTLLSPHVMEFVSDLDTPPGLIAVSASPAPPEAFASQSDMAPLFLVLHQVQLPQNVGAMIRIAEASGVSEVWTTPGTADPFGPKAIRGSAGSVLRVPLRTNIPLHEAISQLAAARIAVVAATQDGHLVYDKVKWDKPTALVLGNEGGGFTLEETKYLKDTLRIPMMGRVESLNVATAAAICLFEAKKKRDHSRHG